MLFSRIRLPLRTITSGVAPSVVTESTAADGVDNDEEDKEDDVDHSHPFPVGLEVLQHPRLARFTAEAEGIGVIAPFIAVWIRAICCWGGLDPHGWALVGKVANLWWFAATRLKSQTKRKERIRIVRLDALRLKVVRKAREKLCTFKSPSKKAPY